MFSAARVIASVAISSAAATAAVVSLSWDELPSLPPAQGQTRQPGVASPFVGVHGDVLIVAGGANFPDKMPWEGGAKAWWDDIWVLEKNRGATPRWLTGRNFKLPRPIAYGVSVSTAEGVVCAGGSDAERCYADVFLLSWDARAREIRRTELPSMPQPLANMAGALVGSTLYVAGGQHVMKDAVPTSVFWALDFAKRGHPSEFKWVELPTWPGPARVLPVAAAQIGSSQGGEFFLFSGRTPHVGAATDILTDAYAFDPVRRAWRKLNDVGGGRGVSVMAGTAAAVGDEILVFGGDRGDVFLALERHDLAIERARRRIESAGTGDRAEFEREVADRLEEKRKIYVNHLGFGRDVFAYSPRTDTWRFVADSPLPPQVTTTAVKWGDAIVIPSGEIRPGVRTAAVVQVRVK